VSSDPEVAVLERLARAPELVREIELSTDSEFALQQRLRKSWENDLVRAALILVDARRRGRAKFSLAGQLWLDRVGLEQSTPEPVARAKARRFQNRSQPVYDLCCGIGADAIALASDGPVIAVDRKPAALWRTVRNAEVYNVADSIETSLADVTQLDLAGQLVHIDPDRRASGQRSLRIELAEPGLDFLNTLIATAAGGAIKLSPAANFGGKFPDCELELVSLDGECKEATIWFGSLRTDARFRATVLPENATLSGDPWEARGRVAPLGRYLYDPDPAVVRAGLIDVACEQLRLNRLDAEEEYLTSDVLLDSAFVTPFEVVADLSNNEKELRNWFRASSVGELEIKCRHVPIQIESVRRQLTLPGHDRAVLLYARCAGKTRAIVARRIVSAG
jgi:SAM-dependent methyltransferase